MHRIVHLDLKGAPWKVSYLEKILLSVRQWGATGILLEWEDTFPYTRELGHLGSQDGQLGCGGDGLYSKEEVLHILWFAKNIGLEAIQLIQTIGHMEFVLKHPAFRGLREMPRSPAVLCPSKPDSLNLVTAMLSQALDLQPDAVYLHIGADEVWHTGVCSDCQVRAQASQHKTASLYLEHIRDVVMFVKQKRPDITVLMWDDMLRSIPLDTLKEYRLGELIEPVLWLYNPMECFQIDPNLWDMYRQLFPNIWAGSAFKGANGSCQIVSPVSRYVSNNQAWLQELRKYGHTINFSGIVLTGWSRYDHYSTLCELLPVSLPSLASCLRLFNKTDGNIGNSEDAVSDTLPSDQWPGEDLARCVHSFAALRGRCLAFARGDLVATWLNPWQLSNSYTNPVQIEGIAMTAQHLLKEVTSMENTLSSHLSSLTGRRSTEEWIQSLVAPISRRLTELTNVGIARFNSDASVTPISNYVPSVGMQ